MSFSLYTLSRHFLLCNHLSLFLVINKHQGFCSCQFGPELDLGQFDVRQNVMLNGVIYPCPDML